MNVVAIIQARMGSVRLPGKILTNLCGKPMLWHIVKRVEKSVSVDKVVVATSTEPEDDAVECLAKETGFGLWRGSQEDVLERFYECASHCKGDVIVRLTGDNALVDAGIIDKGVACFTQKDCDYIHYREGLPLGMSVEIFTYEALKCAYEQAGDKECREHVTPYLYKNPQLFQTESIPCISRDCSHLRWTMDTEQDKELITGIYETLYREDGYFSYEDILREYENHPEWLHINEEIRQKTVHYQGEKQ